MLVEVRTPSGSMTYRVYKRVESDRDDVNHIQDSLEKIVFSLSTRMDDLDMSFEKKINDLRRRVKILEDA